MTKFCNDPPSDKYNQPKYCNCTQGYKRTVDENDFDKMAR